MLSSKHLMKNSLIWTLATLTLMCFLTLKGGIRISGRVGSRVNTTTEARERDVVLWLNPREYLLLLISKTSYMVSAPSFPNLAQLRKESIN